MDTPLFDQLSEDRRHAHWRLEDAWQAEAEREQREAFESGPF